MKKLPLSQWINYFTLSLEMYLYAFRLICICSYSIPSKLLMAPLFLELVRPSKKPNIFQQTTQSYCSWGWIVCTCIVLTMVLMFCGRSSNVYADHRVNYLLNCPSKLKHAILQLSMFSGRSSATWPLS